MTRLLILTILILYPLMASGAIDETEVRLNAQFHTPLRWDNIEDDDPWVDGKRPSYNTRHGFHTIDLGCGDYVRVMLYKGRSLRIYSTGRTFREDDLSIYLSNGSGLYITYPYTMDRQGRSILVTPPEDTPHIVMIEGNCKGRAVEVGLFYSRYEYIEHVAPYRTLIDLPSQRVWISMADKHPSAAFYLIMPYNPITVMVKGGATFSIESMFIYNRSDPVRLQPYHIQVRLDRMIFKNIDHETLPHITTPVYVDGREQVVGRRQRDFMNIPEGEHYMTIGSDAMLYIRVLRRDEPDYLLSINGPRIRARDIRQGLPPMLRKSPWGIDRHRLLDMANDTTSPGLTESLTYSLIRDNTLYEGGIVGTMLLRGITRDIHGASDIARSYYLSHTFYRDIPPDNPSAGSRLYYFITRSLRDLRQPSKIIVHPDHLEDIIKHLPSSIFTGLPNPKDDPLVYHLPERPSPSFLRILVSKEGMEDTLLMLQMDDNPPRVLKSKAEVMGRDDLVPTQSEDALKVLSSLSYPVTPPTLSGRFSSLRPPSRLLDIGYIDVYLPEDVKTIRLWKEGNGIPLVSLQLRVSRPYSLSPTAYMRYIRSIPRGSGLLRDLIRYGEGAIKRLRQKQRWGFPYTYRVMPGDTLEEIFKRVMGLNVSDIYNEYIERFRSLNPHIRDIDRLHPGERIYLPMRFLTLEDIIRIEILNDLMPLYRFIESRSRGFQAGIEDHRTGPHDDIDKSTPVDGLDTVMGLYKGGRYISAIERLQPLLYRSEGIERERLELLQADILRSAGEHFLMENILKGLFVYSRYREISNKAFQRLSEYYKETGDKGRLIGLYSTYILKTHDITLLPRFLELLIETGEYDLALRAGLLLPEGSQPVEALLRASLVRSWWQAFDLLIKGLKRPEERNLWMAKRMLKEGRYKEASELFMKAGRPGRRWYESMVEADSIYKGLRGADDKEIHTLIKRWQRWQKSHPGPFRWRVADELLMDSSGALILYNRARNTYHRMFLSRAGRTVKLTVYGPSRLRIEVRPLFDREPPDAYNGWIELRDNGVPRHYPLIDNLPSDAFRVSGREGLRPGQEVMLVYDVPEGLHHIEVYSDTIPLLVRIYSAEPEVRVSILPPLSTETLSAIIGKGLRGLVESIVREATSAFVRTEVPPLLSVRDQQGQEFIREMIDLLWEAEHNEALFNRDLKRAEEIFINNRQIPGLKRLINRFYRNTRLVLVEDVLESAGIRTVRMTGEATSVPEMRIRTSMLRPLMPGEQLLYGYERVVLHMKNLSEKDLEAEIMPEAIAYLPIEPMEISFEIDGERVKGLKIGDKGKGVVRLHFRVSEGEHYLRIGIVRPVTNQFLRVRLWEEVQGRKRPLIKTIERRYYLATQEEPVTIVVEGPLMLYIEKRRNGEQTMDFMGIDEGIHTINFYPEGPEGEALYRFYRRVPAPERPSIPRRRPVVEYKEVERPAKVRDRQVTGHPRFDDAIPLGSQEDGTWSITGAFVRRRQLEAEDRSEDFAELRLDHRFFNEPSRRLERLGILGRIRRHGGPVFGTSGHITYRPLETPYNYNLNGSFYIQRPEHNGDYEYSLNLDASIVDKREISTKMYHTPSLAGFLRLMSMEDYNGYNPMDVDQDIFTTYKAEHRYGLRISDTLFYMPWLDTILSLYGKVVLNEDLNPFRPDNMGFDLRWRQLIRSIQTSLYYQETHYLPDDDRDEYRTTRRIGLSASIERWLGLNKRLEAGLRLIWHLNIDEFSGRLYLGIHLGRARGYRDFAYGETWFRRLRQMHLSYEEENNRIIIEDSP